MMFKELTKADSTLSAQFPSPSFLLISLLAQAPDTRPSAVTPVVRRTAAARCAWRMETCWRLSSTCRSHSSRRGQNPKSIHVVQR